MFRNSAALAAVFLVSATAGLNAQTAAPLAFEVATIRPAPALDPSKMMAGKMKIGKNIDGSRAEFNFTTIRDLIVEAYGVKPYQVSGPDWMTAERWDVQAKLPEGAKADQVPEMLRAFLEERFKLKIHKDTKDQSVYALIPGKNGPKFKEYVPPAPDPTPASETAKDPAKTEKESGPSMTVNGQATSFKQDGKGGVSVKGGPMGGMKMTQGQNGLMHFEFEQMKMDKFVDFLSNMVDRPVVDQTELKGTYTVGLDLSMQEMMAMARRAGGNVVAVGGPGPAGGGGPGANRPADDASDPGGSSVFTSVEQLGLKLAPKKAPLQQIVVDHVEKTPTEN